MRQIFSLYILIFLITASISKADPIAIDELDILPISINSSGGRLCEGVQFSAPSILSKIGNGRYTWTLEYLNSNDDWVSISVDLGSSNKTKPITRDLIGDVNIGKQLQLIVQSGSFISKPSLAFSINPKLDTSNLSFSTSITPSMGSRLSFTLNLNDFTNDNINIVAYGKDPQDMEFNNPQENAADVVFNINHHFTDATQSSVDGAHISYSTSESDENLLTFYINYSNPISEDKDLYIQIFEGSEFDLFENYIPENPCSISKQTSFTAFKYDPLEVTVVTSSVTRNDESVYETEFFHGSKIITFSKTGGEYTAIGTEPSTNTVDSEEYTLEGNLSSFIESSKAINSTAILADRSYKDSETKNYKIVNPEPPSFTAESPSLIETVSSVDELLNLSSSISIITQKDKINTDGTFVYQVIYNSTNTEVGEADVTSTSDNSITFTDQTTTLGNYVYTLNVYKDSKVQSNLVYSTSYSTLFIGDDGTEEDLNGDGTTDSDPTNDNDKTVAITQEQMQSLYSQEIGETFYQANNGVIETRFDNRFDYRLNSHITDWTTFNDNGKITDLPPGSYNLEVKTNSNPVIRSGDVEGITISRIENPLSGTVNVTHPQNRLYHYPNGKAFQSSFSIVTSGGSGDHQVVGVVDRVDNVPPLYHQRFFTKTSDFNYSLSNISLDSIYNIYILDDVTEAVAIWSENSLVKESILQDVPSEGYIEKVYENSIENQEPLTITDPLYFIVINQDTTFRNDSNTHLRCHGDNDLQVQFRVHKRNRDAEKGVDPDRLRFCLIPSDQESPTSSDYGLVLADGEYNVNSSSPELFTLNDLEDSLKVTFSEIDSGSYHLWVLEDPSLFSGTEFEGYLLSETSIIITQPDSVKTTFETNTVYTNDSSKYYISRNGGNTGDVKLNISGGVGAYTYNVIQEVDDQIIKTISVEDGGNVSTFANLSAGTYSVSPNNFSDESICSVLPSQVNVDSSIFVLNEPDSLQLSLTKEDKGGWGRYQISSFGQNDGKINISVSGGIPAYKKLYYKKDSVTANNIKTVFYSLQGETTDVPNSEDNIDELTEGEYVVVVFDKYYVLDSDIEKIGHNNSVKESFQVKFLDNDTVIGDVVIDSITLYQPPKLEIQVKAYDYNDIDNEDYHFIQDSTSSNQLHVKCILGEKALSGKLQVFISGGNPIDINGKESYIYKYRNGLDSVGIDTLDVHFNPDSNRYELEKFNLINEQPAGTFTSQYRAFGIDIINGNDSLFKEIKYKLLAPEPIVLTFREPSYPDCRLSTTPEDDYKDANGLVNIGVSGGIFSRSNDNDLYYTVNAQGKDKIVQSTDIDFIALENEGVHKEDTIKVKVVDRYDCPCNTIVLEDSYKNSFYSAADSLKNAEEIEQVQVGNTATTYPYFLTDYPPLEAKVDVRWTTCYGVFDGKIKIHQLIGGTSNEYEVGLFTPDNVLLESTEVTNNETGVEFLNLEGGKEYLIKVKYDVCDVYRPLDSMIVTHTNSFDHITSDDNVKLTSATVNVQQPDELKLELVEKVIPYCVDQANGYATLKLSGGYEQYHLTIWEQTTDLSGIQFQTEMFDSVDFGDDSDDVNDQIVEYTINGLSGGKHYKIQVTDRNNCYSVTRYMGEFDQYLYGGVLRPTLPTEGLDEPYYLETENLYGVFKIDKKVLYDSINITSAKASCVVSTDGVINLELINIQDSVFYVQLYDSLDNSIGNKISLDGVVNNTISWDNLSSGFYQIKYIENQEVCGWQELGGVVKVEIKDTVPNPEIFHIEETTCNEYIVSIKTYSNEVDYSLEIYSDDTDSWTIVETSNTEDILNFTEIPSGKYRVSATYGSGCYKKYSDPFSVGDLKLEIEELNNEILKWSDLGSVLMTVRVDGNLTNDEVSYILYKFEDGNYIEVSSSEEGNYSSLTKGNYRVIARRTLDGCTQVQSSNSIDFEVTIPDKLSITTIQDPNSVERCSGSNSAVALVNLTGGEKPYHLSILGEGSSEVLDYIIYSSEDTLITGLNWGENYNFYVRDNISETELNSTVEFLSTEVEVLANVISKDYCNLQTGEVDVTVNNLVSEFSIYLNNKFIRTESVNNFVLQDLPSGNYKLYVIDNATGCTSDVIDFEIQKKPSEYTAKVERVSLPNCGAGNGHVEILIENLEGVPLNSDNYTIQWIDENQEDDIFGAVRTDLTTGAYQVLVTDNQECSIDTLQFTLDSRDNPRFSEDLTQRVLPYCGQSTGEIVIQVDSGAAPYSLTALEGITIENADYHEGVFHLSGLLVDENYIFELNDVNSVCTSTVHVKIEEERKGHIFNAISGVMTPTSCGQRIGSFEVTNFPSSEYKIEWFDDTQSDHVINQSGNILDQVGVGNYHALVTHLETKCDTTITIEVGERNGIDLQFVALDSSDCGMNTGSIDVIANGGGGLFTYTWTKGNFEFDINSEKIEELFSGTYQVFATDQYGCTSNIVRVNIQDRPSLLANLIPEKNASCSEVADGVMSVYVRGGLPPYEYNWNNSGFVLNKSRNTALTEGKQAVEVRDSRGCIIEVKPVEVVAEKPIDILFTISNPTCIGSVDGQLTNITINKSDDFISQIQLIDSLGKVVFSNTSVSDITGLSAGKYEFYITSNTGCSITKTLELMNPLPIQLNLSFANKPKCVDGSDGSLFVNVTGGSGQFSYEWKDSSGSTVGNEALLQNVPVGLYQLNVSDDNSEIGCFENEEYRIGEVDSLRINQIVRTAPSCYGNNDGEIKIQIKGGEGPYQVKWDEFDNFTTSLRNIPVGDYRVIIQDRNACIKDTVIKLIEQPLPLSVEVVSVIDATCTNSADGSVELEVSGGTAPYTINWSNNQRGTSLSRVKKGTYTVDVYDQRGCTYEQVEVTVGAPDPLIAEVIETNHPSCIGEFDGNVTIKVIGGTKGYSVSSSDQVYIDMLTDSTYKVEGYKSGLYNLTLSDTNSCSSNYISFRLIDPDPIRIDSVSIINTSCYGGSNGEITVLANGGSNQLSYLWNNGRIGNTIEDIPEGVYSVTVTDNQKGCQQTFSYTITSPLELIGEVKNFINPTCIGANDGEINIEVSGGTPPYTYEWSNGITSKNINTLSKGNYSVIITDNNGCSLTLDQNLIDPEPIVVDIHNLQELIEICEGSFYTIDAGNEWSEVRWTSDRGMDDFNEVVILTEAGNYTLHLTTQKGCETSYDFEVVLRDDLLTPQFLIDHSAEEVYDTYVIVDLTQPIPDNIQWTIEPQVDVVDSTNYTYEIRFLEAGEYTIRQRTSLANCIAEKVQVVNVSALTGGRFGIVENDILTKQEEVRKFEVIPNPSRGTFDINVELIEKMNINVALHYLNGLKVWEQTLSNDDHYQLKYSNDKLPTGMYILKLKTLKGVKVLKVMISN